MSSETILKATHRTITGKQVSALRREGKLPAVVNGKHISSFPISLDLHETTLILRGLPSSHLIKLDVEGEIHNVLLREKQYFTLINQLMHLDFLAVSMDEKLITQIPIRLVGTAPVIKEFEAMLLMKLNELEVEVFPADLPDYIDVNVSSLSELGSSIKVGQLSLSDKIEVRHDLDEEIVIAISAVAEEIEEEVAAEVAEPELISKGKEEKEEE